MAVDLQAEGDRKSRQKKLRRDLMAVLERLRGGCETLETVDDWYERLEPLRSLLEKDAEAFPEGTSQRLEDAQKLTDSTREGLKLACKELRLQIESVIDVLPAEAILGMLPTMVLGVFLVVAAGIAATSFYLSSTAVTIDITNVSCDPIPPMIGTATLLGYVPGVQLPTVAIARGQTLLAKAPAATVRVDGTRPGALTVSTIMGGAVPVLP